MKENLEIQLFTVNFNTVKYTDAELMGKLPWHSQKPDFLFSLSLFLSAALHVVLFLEQGFFFVVVVRDFRKPELHGSQFAQPLFTVCRWKSCQFAAQSFGSLLITTSALCIERNDADVFGWHTASLREVLQAAEYLLWDTEALSMLQNWASNEACLLHAFSK